MIQIQDDPSVISPIFQEMRRNTKTLETHNVAFRKKALENLLNGYEKLKPQIDEAIKQDLGMNSFMANFLAHGITTRQISDLKDHLDEWTQPQSIQTPVTVGLAKSSVQYQPLGLVLVISAWNYPIYTSLPQVAAAIAAGNSVILKPSQMAPYSSKILAKLFKQHLNQKYYRCLEGRVQIARAISKLPFDMICFTGSTATGKSIAIEAAKNLTPCMLELGGKCPVIVDQTADIDNAVLRILFGKFTNAGQTCVGADHVFIHEKIADKFKAELLKKLKEGYKVEDIKVNGDFAKIINEHHVKRLTEYLNQNHGGKVLVQGIIDKQNRFVSPFVIENPRRDSLLMNQQIFGPILPLRVYSNLDQVIQEVNQRSRPLVVYAFSEDSKKIQKIKRETTSGAFVTNDIIVQLLNPNLPFGGVGASGYGRYHGIAGFQAFSNPRSILYTKAINWYPLSNRFAPYTDSKKRMMTFLLKLGSLNVSTALKGTLIIAAGLGAFFFNKNIRPML